MKASLLIIGGAGGVDSILIQLAKKLTNLTVVATASRLETIEWTKKMGADQVINHRVSLVYQLKDLDLQPAFVASLSGSDGHFPSIVELIKPRGHIALIHDGVLITTVTQHHGNLSVETLRQAHELQESGRAIGKNEIDRFR